MGGTQASLLCLAPANIPCGGFREAVASQDGKRADSSSPLTAKRGVLPRAEGTVTSECPSPKPRDLGAGTLFITLPLISPPSLCSLPVGLSGSTCWFCAVGHPMQAVEGIAQTPSLVPLCPPSPNCTVDHCLKAFGGSGRHLAA